MHKPWQKRLSKLNSVVYIQKMKIIVLMNVYCLFAPENLFDLIVRWAFLMLTWHSFYMIAVILSTNVLFYFRDLTVYYFVNIITRMFAFNTR